jgi:hypothetical protein
MDENLYFMIPTVFQVEALFAGNLFITDLKSIISQNPIKTEG